MYVIVTNHVNWHRESLCSDRKTTGMTGNSKMQFEGPLFSFGKFNFPRKRSGTQHLYFVKNLIRYLVSNVYYVGLLFALALHKKKSHFKHDYLLLVITDDSAFQQSQQSF